MFEFILFVLACVVSFFIPGYLLLQFTRISLDPLERYILSWFIGLSIFTLATYLLAWNNLSQLYVWLSLFLGLLFIKIIRKDKNKSVYIGKKIDWTTLIIILTGSTIFLFAMFFSGLEIKEGLQYFWVNAKDGVRHVAYTKNMLQYFPPEHSGIAGEAFRGFHYFYDFILSRLSLFYGFSVENLYFRYFPLFISLLYGGAFYLVGSAFTKDIIKRRFILFFAYFAQSSTILVWFFQKSTDLTDHASVQPLGLIINPFTVLSLGMLLVGLVYLPQLKKSWKYAIIIALQLGILSQFKVYAGLIAIGTYLLFGIYQFIQNKFQLKTMLNYIIAGIFIALLTLLTYFPNNYKAGGLLFTPFLFYSHFIQKEQFALLQWETKRTIFAEHNNTLRIILLYTQAVGIFWIINLGARLIMFIKIRTLLSKSYWTNNLNIIFTAALFVSVFIGTFFIQSVSPLDTVQFFWIAFALLSIPSGLVLGEIYNKQRTFYKVGIIILLLIVTLPGVLDFLSKNISISNRLLIPSSFVEVAKTINVLVPEREYLVYAPLEGNKQLPTNTLIIGAITGRSVYLEEGGIPGRFEGEYNKRRALQDKLKKVMSSCDEQEILSLVKQMGTRFLLTNKELQCLSKESVVTSISTLQRNFIFYQLR